MIQLGLIVRTQKAMLHVVYRYIYIHYIYENWYGVTFFQTNNFRLMVTSVEERKCGDSSYICGFSSLVNE